MGGSTEAIKQITAEPISVNRQDQRQRNTNTTGNANRTLTMQHQQTQQQTNNRSHVVSPPLQGMQTSASINQTAAIGAQSESYSESKKGVSAKRLSQPPKMNGMQPEP